MVVGMIASLTGTYGVGVSLRWLSPAYVREHLDTLISIGADVPGEYWREAHFLKEFPEKWVLSRVIEFYGQPIAYAIVSQRNLQEARLHHLMVAKEYRGLGAGSRLFQEVVAIVTAYGYARLTLHTDGAGDFYARQGCRQEWVKTL